MGLLPSLPQSRTEVLKLDEAWSDAWRHKEMGQKQQPVKEQKQADLEKVGGTPRKRLPLSMPLSLLPLTVPSLPSDALGEQGFGHQTNKSWNTKQTGQVDCLSPAFSAVQQLRSQVYFTFVAIGYIKYTMQSYKAQLPKW